MVKNNCKNKAFSLVEMLVSMMIIMVVVAGFIPTLTKSKPKVDITTKRGQYGCWYEGSKLYEQYFDERTPRTAKKDVTSTGCKLKLDESPAHFYIIATGAGCNGVAGQATTLYTPGLAETLNIKLGKYNTSSNRIIRDETCATTISSNSMSNLVVANGGFKFSNNYLNPHNFSNTNPCKLKSAGDFCKGSSTAIQQSCTVSEINGINSNDRFIVRINGCESFDEYGNPNEDNIIKLNQLVYSAGTNKEITSSTSTNSRFYYPSGDANKTYKMNFTNADPLFGREFTKKSKMVQLIDNIPSQRRSSLFSTLKDPNIIPGAPDKNGAVIIMW